MTTPLSATAVDDDLRCDVASYFLVDPVTKQDPLAVWNRIRAAEPVHWCDLGFWVVTGFADTVAMLRDDRWSRNPQNAVGAEPINAVQNPGPARSTIADFLLFKDPPDHTRLRGLVNKTFTPKTVKALERRIVEIVDGLLDRLVARSGPVDFKAAFSRPMPQALLAEMLGVPEPDQPQLYRWSKSFLVILRPQATPEQEATADAATTAFREYVLALIDERRRRPTDDLLSTLVAAEEAGERLSTDELVATCILLIAAGLDTTTHMIENGLVMLLDHPDERRRLDADPSLWPAAVEEILRYDTPAPNALARWAKEDLELGGTRIARGQKAIGILVAANHDPAQFADPARFDVGRSDNRQIAFGFGAHFCLGAYLARVEGRIALERLFTRCPDIRRTSPLEWAAVYGGRELTTLTVEVG